MRKFCTVIMLILVFSTSCKKGSEKTADEKNTISDKLYVSASAGLKLREQSNQNAKLIVVIPYGSEVNVIEESGEVLTIAGKTGKWTKIDWNGNKGWAFGGFLEKTAVEKKPTETSFESKCMKECSENNRENCIKINETYKRYNDSWSRVSKNDQLALDDAGFARKALVELCPETVASDLVK